MKLSFTLCGGLGDFILNYLGSPGNRVANLIQATADIELRVSDNNPAGLDLIRNNPFFQRVVFFTEANSEANRLPNDITKIPNLQQYNKLTPPVWLDQEEEDLLHSLPRPYAVFHPFASGGARGLSAAFDIHYMAQWIADTSGLPLVVMGREEFGYKSHNVFQIKGSSRLAVSVVSKSTFFVGTHSSMQCAAWVYDIPSMCIGPSSLLFHDWYSRNSFDTYLKPLFKQRNIFMMYNEAAQFPNFFDHFLKSAIALKPSKSPEESRNRIILSGMALDYQKTLDRNPC